ncbi:MAG: chromosomal replication initiator protein DnaA [Alphaproteobacteria bacterium]|nr:chromosomal replication initiator protein DnaA [Alphaproteobacteria bacterium]
MGGGSADPRLAGQWVRIRGVLRAEAGDAAFRSWLKKLTLIERDDRCVRLGAPTKFMRDWVVTHYGERLGALWREEDPRVETVDVVIQLEVPAATPPRAAPAPAEERADEPSIAGVAIGAALDPRFTFENFVVGKPNELAFAAARRVAESPTAQYNPLFLYGSVGLGKTHLMHAIAWHIRAQTPQRKVVYLSAEQFMFHFIRAIRYKNTMAFKDEVRSVDVLMIDDVQFINGKESTQEEFFHTFNALVDSNRQIVVSADKSPHDLEGMEERLRSRLGWGLVADIHATSFELRLSILQTKAEQHGIRVPEEVLKFLAQRITSNVRELEGALTRLIAEAVLIGRDITMELCQTKLRDLLKANERRVTIEEIQKKVAEHFNIRLSDMGSVRRSRAVARPRQVAMYLAKHLTTRSLPEIGRKFGGRDHTTVIHAVRKIEDLIRTDASLAEDVELLRRGFEQ